jgi:hypothetical protein
LKTKILGINQTHYETIDLGDKYAKLDEQYEDNDKQVFKLTSRHKKGEFIMEIETVWTLKKGKKTFSVVHSIVEIDLFGVIQEIFVVPESHLNILRKIYSMM